MKFNSCFILVYLCCIVATYAQQLTAQTGNDTQALKYDLATEYLQLRVQEVSYPDLNRNESKFRRFLRRFFSDRSNYGLIYVESQYRNAPPRKTLLMQFERNDDDDYEFKSVAANNGLGYPISERFVYGEDADVELRLVVKSWEDESSQSSVKKIINKIPDLSSLVTVDEILNMIESVFPPKNTVDDLTLSLNKEALLSGTIDILYQEEKLLTINSTKYEGLFSHYSLEPNIRSDLIGNIDTWSQVIREADKEFVTNGLNPLLGVLSSFSNYVYDLPLTSKDKALLIAGSIHKWAPNALEGKEFDGNFVQFDSVNYLRLIEKWDITLVRNTNWDFQGTSCLYEPCNKMSIFLARSRSSRSKKELAKTLVSDGLTIKLPEEGILSLSPDDFVEDSTFKILYSARFEPQVNPDGSRIYKFERGGLPLIVNGNLYQDGYRVRIHMSILGNNYSISHIDINKI